MELRSVGMIGVGSYIPEKVLTNFDLEKMVSTSDEWIRTRTGIVERRVVEDGQFTSDLAAEAGRKAIKEAGLKASDIELLVVATSSPDMIFPSTACLALEKLGIRKIPAFDVSAACSGFVFGLSVAYQYLAAGTFNNALIIGADALTRYVDWTDRNTCVLFGDGAGAVVLGQVEDGFGILGSFLSADGSGADLLKIPGGGCVSPGDETSVKKKLHYISMNGNEVFKFAVRAIPEATKKALAACHLKVDDVTYIIPHQANKRIIEAAASRLGVDVSKVVNNIDRYGNTSTASIPLVVDELWRGGKLKKGDILVLVGFGAGLTWGANVVKWSKAG